MVHVIFPHYLHKSYSIGNDNQRKIHYPSRTNLVINNVCMSCVDESKIHTIYRVICIHARSHGRAINIYKTLTFISFFGNARVILVNNVVSDYAWMISQWSNWIIANIFYKIHCIVCSPVRYHDKRFFDVSTFWELMFKSLRFCQPTCITILFRLYILEVISSVTCILMFIYKKLTQY